MKKSKAYKICLPYKGKKLSELINSLDKKVLKNIYIQTVTENKEGLFGYPCKTFAFKEVLISEASAYNNYTIDDIIWHSFLDYVYIYILKDTGGIYV